MTHQQRHNILYYRTLLNKILSSFLRVSTTLSLQRVQNDAARLILGLDRRTHITPALKKLHWLPIPNTIFKNQNCSFYAPVFSSPLSTVHLRFSQLQDRYRSTSFRDDKSGRHSSTTDQSRQTSILNRRPFCLEQFASIS